MKKQESILKQFKIDKEWTLFLDRDGVINKKIENDYVKSWSEFKFIDGVIEALRILQDIFGRIIIITNQRGIGRGLMSEQELLEIHNNMINILSFYDVKIDGIYYCPHDYEKEICNCRKPKPGLAYKAKENFPEIDFKKSFMVGDSISDMEFGKSLGMYTVFISKSRNATNNLIDSTFYSLLDFVVELKK